MKDVKELKVLMHKVNATFHAYEHDVRMHKGWGDEDKRNAHSKKEYLEALSELTTASLPHESNAIDLGELIIRKPCGIDDIDAMLNAGNIPANLSMISQQ